MKGQFATATPAQQFLSFSLNPNLQALLSAQQLAEIVRLAPATIIAIPQMPEAVIGVCPWQGEVLWLVDLAYLLGLEPLIKSANIQSNSSILKIRSQQGNLGLLVAQIGQLVSCEPSSIQPADLSLNKLKRLANSLNIEESAAAIPHLCIQGSWTHPDGSILPIINIEALIQYLVQD